MGITTFVSPWIDDPNYIVNLTKSLVTEGTLSKLTSQGATGSNPRALCLVLTPRLAAELMKLKPETLGLICAYGTEQGFHYGTAVAAPFLNLTGYRNVMVDGKYDLRAQSGRSFLETMALFTIVCVARDIIRQAEWQVRVARWIEDDEQHERGMEDYIHGRDRKI